MIRRDELRRLAARAGVRVVLQERDYVLGWFLLGLPRIGGLCQALVFKGGTALRKVYFPDYRFSEDLDFTLVEPMEAEALQADLAAVCREVREASGVQMTLALWKQTRSVPGQEAYRARVEYVGPLGRLGSAAPRITLDLACYERLVLPPVRRPIGHPYSDAPSEAVQVPTYRLEEMLAEKLRALLQRCYPRDIYDVWYLLSTHAEQVDRRLSLHALEDKCRYKGYPFSAADGFLLLAGREGLAEAWKASLEHLVPSLPSWATVMRELRVLLHDWLGDHASVTGPGIESPV